MKNISVEMEVELPLTAQFSSLRLPTNQSPGDSDTFYTISSSEEIKPIASMCSVSLFQWSYSSTKVQQAHFGIR